MSILAPGRTVARYTILGRLATGGMAEVYLARQGGPSGFSKLLVLKVILPQLADDPKFVQMFHNEAKLAALLNHPNVVQIFDFGVEDHLHYIAMEYIDGRNLNRILRTLVKSGYALPVPVALRLVSDAAGALEYAHGLTDPTGVPLQVIHRDVSFENILLTYTGQVKLVDFGIAKARTLESHTVQGALKGKYSYMAPELVEGKRIDHRIDIYALGVVLYRLLTNELPFVGDSHEELLHRIRNWPAMPPRELRPELEEELEQIVLRALAKDREVRYQRAGELQAELERYLQRRGAAVMAYQLSQFMASLFPPGTDEDRETYLQLAGGTSPQTPASRSRPTAGNPTGPGFPSVPLAPSPTLPPEPLPPLVIDAGSPSRAVDATEREREHERPGRWEVDTGPGAAPAADASADTDDTAIFDHQSVADPTRPTELPPGLHDVETAESPLASAPTRPRLVMPPLRSGGRSLLLAALAMLLLGLAVGAGLLLRRRAPAAAPDAGPGSARPAARAEAGPGANDHRAGPDGRAAVELGLDGAAEPATLPAERGTLSLQSLAPAEVLIDGKRVGSVPLTALALPPGSHRLQVRSSQHHYAINRSISIQPGRELDLKLTPREGQLRILVRPWAVVTLDGNRLGTTPIPPASVYEGPHQLQLENAELGAKKKMRVMVKAGKEEVVKVYLD